MQHSTERNLFRKNFIWNIIGTTLNAFNSLFFMVIVTRVNGMEDSGVFTMAFSLAALFCIIGGYSGRVFQVTDRNANNTNKDYIIQRFFTFALMMLVSIVYCIVQRYDWEKVIVTLSLCLMKGFEILADVYYGILQKNDRLYFVGKSLTYKAFLSLLSFLIIDFITKSLILSCIVLVMIWFLFLVFYDIPKAKSYINPIEKYSFTSIYKLTKAGFFLFLVLFLSIYLCNAPKYALDGRVSEELKAVFGIILMPATVISMCAQYLLQPFLNRMSLCHQKKDRKGLIKITSFLVICISGIGLLGIAAAWLAGIPVLNLIYGVKLEAYLPDLLLIIAGATLYAVSTVFSSVLTTMRYTLIQAVIYGVCSAVSFGLSIYLIQHYAIRGASVSYFITMLLQFIFYVAAFLFTSKKTYQKKEEIQ